MHRSIFPTARAACLVLAVSLGAQAAEPVPVDFEREILPLLKSRCYECHDQRKATAGYRIDVRAAAARGGESGVKAIVPGHADESDLLKRVSSSDDSLRMPPEGEPLTPAEIARLKRWIDAGAPWPDALAGLDPATSRHWAFQPPQRPELPEVKATEWIRNAIDRFVLARLEADGLTPSPEADRITLIRRLSLDLLGLPPSVADVDAFVADRDPKAYPNLVERLLASPHYGERWGRLWLDAARYADSDGFEKDKPRFVWFYRDYVINAHNRDLPYNLFIIEQIAGDLLPGGTQDQLVATGFLRNSMINEEGGVDPEQFRMEAMFDRMDAVGKGVLGLTIQCAQCHNHKYDPLTQLDYYRMFACLNDSHEGSAIAYTPAEQQQRADLFRQIAEIEAGLKESTPDWPAKLAAWEETVRGDQPDWTVVQSAEDDLSGGQKMYRLPDGSYLCQGYAPTKHTVVVTVVSRQPKITGFRLEQLNDPNLPLSGPGRSIYGTSALTEFKVHVKPLGKPDEARWVKFVRATSDADPPERPLEPLFGDKTDRKRVTGPVDYAIDGKDETAWTIDVGPGRRNVPRKAVFVPELPITLPEGSEGLELQFHLVQNHGGWNSDDNQNMNLGRFRLAVTAAENPVADSLSAAARAALQVPASERSAAQQAALFGAWRATVPEWKAANDRIEVLWQQHPAGASQLVLSRRETPRMTHLLKRGDFLKPGSTVEPGVPGFLNSLPDTDEPDRLAFARWLADRNSPTTARALVNRVWQAYFGAGLVETSEDLGTQAAPPSHPELLDWLAVEFMERGWSQKELHRLIVNSATYRQSSRVTPEQQAIDPNNRLLGRGARFRVDAELVRDITLAASSLLNEDVGGPSVFPPLPAFMLLPPASYGPKTWPESQGAERHRRALYTFRYRSLPYPVLQAFDAPNGDFACVRRNRSNTPLQALMTLNEPVFLEAARGLAERTLAGGGATDAERLKYAFRCCVARPPANAELQELQQLLQDQRAHFSQPGIDAAELAGGEDSTGHSPAERAAWTAVARVLLNLDETITRE